MDKYMKKPVVVEAMQITDDMFDDPHPNTKHLTNVTYDPTKREVIIRTLEGELVGRVGDWLVRYTNGELFPCQDAIFRAIYQPFGD